MKDIKQALIKIAKQNKKEDLQANAQYWDDVITEISTITDEAELLELAQMSFGFDSFQQIMESTTLNKIP